MSDESFYNKIDQVALKDAIDFLDHNNSEITIKILGQYIKTNVNSRKNEKQLSLPKFDSFEFSNEPVSCVFQIKDDRYFFRSFLTNGLAEYNIDIPAEIYQLQRRSDYRVVMPIGVNYKCKIVGHNDSKALISIEIRDISLGGCLISIPGLTSDYNVNDKLDLFLQLDKFEFQKIPAVIKHIRHVDSQNNTLLGSAFEDPESEMRSQLLAMLMHLDRVKRRKAQ